MQTRAKITVAPDFCHKRKQISPSFAARKGHITNTQTDSYRKQDFMTKKTALIFAASATVLLATACATAPEPVVEEVVVPPVLQTCYPIASLEKVVVPAVVQTGYSITSIESPTEHYTDPKTGEVTEIQTPPIQSKMPYSREIEPERIYYKTAEGEITDDICELKSPATEPKPAVTDSPAN